MAISRSRDKLRAMQLLSRHGIGLPVTGYASTHDVPDLITMVGAPAGGETAGGHPGIGVVPVRNPKAAESVIEGFIQTNSNIWCGSTSGGQRRRHPLPGGGQRQVVAAMRRQAQPGVSLQPAPGGTARAIKIAGRACHRCLQAAKIVGLDVGMNILRSARGPLVLGWKPSPVRGGCPARTWRARSSSSSSSRRATKHKPAEWSQTRSDR